MLFKLNKSLHVNHAGSKYSSYCVYQVTFPMTIVDQMNTSCVLIFRQKEMQKISFFQDFL